MPRETYQNRQGWNQQLPRFYIEERTGCIAVIDSTLRDPQENCLEPDTLGVLWFRMGEQHKCTPCETCGHSSGMKWVVPEKLIDEAIKQADILNGL